MSEHMTQEVVNGLRAAAIDAIAQARRNGTPLVVMRDGKIVEISPEEAEAMMNDKKTQKDKQ